jgi:hypothetical protein
MTFRAGRYGFDGKVAAILSDLGYIADCSVTPLVSWKKIVGNPQGKGGPDFSGVLPHPYFLDMADCTKEGNSQLLEVPISIFFLQGPLFNKCFHLLKTYIKDPQDLMLRGLYKLGYKPVWFRPRPGSSVKELIQVYKMAQSLQIDYIEMILHSSELMPGGSKNTKTKESVEKFYEIFQGLFQFLHNENVESVTLTEYAENRF